MEKSFLEYWKERWPNASCDHDKLKVSANYRETRAAFEAGYQSSVATVLCCEIFECGKNILGKCSEKKVTLSLKNICDCSTITFYDREQVIPPTLKKYIAEIEEDLHSYESNGYALDDLQDEVDNLEHENYKLERKVETLQMKLDELQNSKPAMENTNE